MKRILTVGTATLGASVLALGAVASVSARTDPPAPAAHSDQNNSVHEAQIQGTPNGTATKFKVNARGERYGSELDSTPGDEPDLVLAYGEDYTEGYVRTADLRPKFGSPSAALAYSRKAIANGGIFIPLYSADGVTVIGRFWLSAT